MRRLQINGGQVLPGATWQLVLPPHRNGYADAQLDDYGRLSRRSHYRWLPGSQLSLRARFAPGPGLLRGTAGFGFWNAPFGDPTIRWPALPQAAWFFYASPPTDLPLAAQGAGRGWFAATIDAGRPSGLALLPFAPLILPANQFAPVRQRLLPHLRRALGISFARITAPIEQWHQYDILWLADGCRFLVDGQLVLHTRHSPRGPLGFVCWIDNQYLVATIRGRVRWGTLPTAVTQTLEIDNLRLGPAAARDS